MVRKTVFHIKVCRVSSLFIQPNTTYGRFHVELHIRKGKVNIPAFSTKRFWRWFIIRSIILVDFSHRLTTKFKTLNFVVRRWEKSTRIILLIPAFFINFLYSFIIIWIVLSCSLIPLCRLVRDIECKLFYTLANFFPHATILNALLPECLS